MTTFSRHLANAFPASRTRLDRDASVRAELAAMETDIAAGCHGDRGCMARARTRYDTLSRLGAWDKADQVAKRYGVKGSHGLDFSRIFGRR